MSKKNETKKETKTESQAVGASMRVRKLSTRSVLGDVSKLVKAGKLPFNQPVVRFLGHVNATETVETQYGVSTRFVGTFEGVNLLTGEAYTSSELFLPGTMETMVADKFDSLGDGEMLAFAADVLLEPQDKGVGYAYVVKPIMDDGVDPLAALKATLPDLPKLAAPKA